MQPRQLHARLLADATQWHASRLARELDYFDDAPDVDEGKYGYCPACECNVPVKQVDYGFGFEHGSVVGYHSDVCEECPECEGPLQPERDEAFESEAE
jgi:hypothetical protein